jgi:CubicO group peptidase (beta-lactamase class C family)
MTMDNMPYKKLGKTLFATLFVIVSQLTGTLSAAGPGPGEISEIDAIFGDFDTPETPGCSLGVIRNDEFIYRRAYGMANLEYDIPLTSRSVFRIGSTSKQFTAMAIALLAESGQISMDDPLSKYFPEFPAWASQISIRHLVHHISGIRDYLDLAYLAGKTEDSDYFSDDWAIALLARQREGNFPPGSRFLYSNSGYLLLAHLVRRSTGQSLGEFSEKNIFSPLGMKNTHFHDDHTHIVRQRASGYAPTDGGFSISMTTLDIVGDGSIYTNVDDLLLWDRNFYHNRLGKGGPELIERVTTAGTLSSGEKADYGAGPSFASGEHYAHGLILENYRGLPMISHGGAFVGYRAEMIRFPEQRFSVAVLCNRSDGAPTSKARQVADYYLADLLQARPEKEMVDQVLILNADQLQVYAGDFWEATEFFAAETQVDGGKLWAVHSAERRNELAPIGPHRFRMLGLPEDIVVEFKMNDSGIQEMTRIIDGYPSGTFTPFARREISPGELEEYAGNYYSPELDVRYMLEMDDGRLMFRMKDRGARELTAMFGETFESPDWGAFEFKREADRDISGFLLSSGRVRNVLFQRQ